MASTTSELQPVEEYKDKGLKGGALGLLSSIVIGVASTAPAYSLAATLGFVAVLVGFHSPAVAVLAFVPMVLCSVGYSELNKADPDCGTTFTWASRAIGPKAGWAGGWGIIAADILVMASLAQVAGQYVFLLFNPNSTIGANPASGWVLLVGILWIVAMTYICYRGIEVSANFQKVLLSVEVVMLAVLAITALVKATGSHPPPTAVTPHASWLLPTNITFTAFVGGLVLMLFIYWGWDTAVSVNEETKDKNKTPGQAAIISTVILLAIYAVVIFAALAFAGIGSKGIGLTNTSHSGDVLSVLGTGVFGSTGFGSVLSRLLILMVLSSAAASTQTTILPTARTTLSMAAYQALPRAFAKIHPKHLTPTVSTLVMGAISIALYVPMNYISGGKVIPDAVTAIGLFIAFYYGLTAFSCVWYYRKTLTNSARDLWMRGILPLLGGLIMYAAGIYALWEDWDVAVGAPYTQWKMPGTGWIIGGPFIIAFLAGLAGVIAFIFVRVTLPPFFRKETLTRSTPTLVPDK